MRHFASGRPRAPGANVYLRKPSVRRPSLDVRRSQANLTGSGPKLERPAPRHLEKPAPEKAGVEWRPGELYPRVGFIVTTMARSAETVVSFYNRRCACEQGIREDGGAIRWTRQSCRSFAASAVRLRHHALAYNPGDLARMPAKPQPIKERSPTNRKQRPIVIGAKVVSHGRYVAFQMAELSIARSRFADIPRPIPELRPAPVTSMARGVGHCAKCHGIGVS